MDLIEPAEWDVIVLGSGLPECLIASALSAPQNGQSVLLIDEDDTYGSDYASFTLACMEGRAVGKQGGAVGPMDSYPAVSNKSTPKSQPAHHFGDDFQTLALPELCVPISDVEIYRLPGADLGRERAFILDLMPKVCYQAESLVDILIRTRAHNYMEFKQVEGSYIYTVGKGSKIPAPRFSASSATPASNSTNSSSGSGVISTAKSSMAPTLSARAAAACPAGAIRPVPASKSDVFQDRSLSLMEKRQLMNFISSTVEAVEGRGKLKDLISSGIPLSDLLSMEGLPDGLKDVIMYGIAMCDQRQCHTQAAKNEPQSTAPSSSIATDVEAKEPSPDLTTAGQGAASLQLLMHSMGRFGAPGAFMVPGFGCGSVSEAFVRFCAVRGATTVLRYRVDHLLLGNRPLPVAAAAAAAPNHTNGSELHETKDGGSGVGGLADVSDPHDGASCGADDNPPCPTASASALSSSASDPSNNEAGTSSNIPDAASSVEQSFDGSRVLGMITASGQVLRCKTLVASSKTLAPLMATVSSQTASCGQTTNPTLNTGPHLSRMLAVLDSSLVPGRDHLMLVFPPYCPALGGQNPHPVRGLQLGPSAHVSPSGRYLLYMSTVGDPNGPAGNMEKVQDGREGEAADSSCSAQHAEGMSSASRKALQDALMSLVHTDGLASDTGKRHPSDEPPGAVPGTGQIPAGDSQGSDPSEGLETSTSALPVTQPKALQVHYYNQELAVVPASWEEKHIPSNVVCCSMPEGLGVSSAFGLVGYESMIKHTEQTFRRHFPEATWLTEVELDTGDQLREEREEDAAISDLESVISKLQAAEVVAEDAASDKGSNEEPIEG